jgi:hypothetical protein
MKNRESLGCIGVHLKENCSRLEDCYSHTCRNHPTNEDLSVGTPENKDVARMGHPDLFRGTSKSKPRYA